MVNYVSNQNGDVTTDAVWTPNGSPGPTDTIEVKHDIATTSADFEILIILINDDGELNVEGDIIYDDTSGAGLIIEDNGNLVNDGSFGDIRTMKSASNQPTNPWQVDIEDVVGQDTRNLNFDWISCQGNLPFLGNDTYEIDFNVGGTNDPRLLQAVPLTKEPYLESHVILKRKSDREYHNGSSSGVVTLQISVTKVAMLEVLFKQMIESGERFAFIGLQSHLPKCYIERADPSPRKGSFIDFFVILREAA